MNKNKPGAGRPFGTYKGSFPTRIGGSLTPLYKRWVGMTQRCTNPKCHIWKYYGGRGITVCPEWLGFDGYQQFCRDMGEPGRLWLDRIDNDKGYSKDNCRWTTTKISGENKRQGGRKNAQPMSLNSICSVFGVPYMRTYFRIKHFKWTYSEAFK